MVGATPCSEDIMLLQLVLVGLGNLETAHFGDNDRGTQEGKKLLKVAQRLPHRLNLRPAHG